MKWNFRNSMLIIFMMISHSSIASNPMTDHVYFGGVFGIAGLSDQESTRNPISDKHTLGIVGPLGGGLLGYHFNLCHSWKLGVEGFFNAIHLKLDDKQNYSPLAVYTVDMRYNTGVRILPSYELTPETLGHLILGYSYAKFNINDDGNYGIVNQNFYKNGFQTGLGMETILYKKFTLRSDLLYTFYSTQTSYGITTSSPPSVQTYQNKFSTLEANLALVYNL